MPEPDPTISPSSSDGGWRNARAFALKLKLVLQYTDVDVCFSFACARVCMGTENRSADSGRGGREAERGWTRERERRRERQRGQTE